MVPIFGFVSLLGCQSAQEQASASSGATIATAQSETTKVVVPNSAGASGTTPIQKVTTADSEISDRAVVVAKAAFEKNKCGVCHSVGAFAAAKAPATKRDLSGVGLTRSSVWIAGFLQKKEKIDGKLHMKLFGGSDAELAVLSEWLASQKTVPVPAKTSSTN